MRGESHPMARLSASDVVEIRAASGRERQVDTAARFGVSQVLVSKIQRGVIWKVIPAPE